MTRSLQKHKVVVPPRTGKERNPVRDECDPSFDESDDGPRRHSREFPPSAAFCPRFGRGIRKQGGFDSLRPRAPICLLLTKGMEDELLQLPHNGSPPNARALPRRISAVPTGATHALESGAAATHTCSCASESLLLPYVEASQGRKNLCCMREEFRHKKGTQRQRVAGKGGHHQGRNGLICKRHPSRFLLQQKA